MNIILIISGILIAAAVLLSFIRFIIGPTVYDRIAALDVLTLITTVVIIVLSIMYKQKIFMAASPAYGRRHSPRPAGPGACRPFSSR